jgi:hypothetical protein
MSKKGSLENLISSLNKAEKRYFRLFSALQSGSKQYLNLFDKLESHNNGKPVVIKNKAKLSVTKNYLCRLILKSLKGYNEGKSRRSELLHLLLEIEILFQKEHYSLCMDRIKKARKLAQKYEHFVLLLEILNWERRMINTIAAPSSRAAIEKIMELEIRSVAIIDNYNQYNLLVHELLGKGFSDTDLMQNYLQHPLLKNEQCAKSFAALTLYYHLHYILFTVTSQGEKGRIAINSLVDLMEQTPFRIEENPEAYVTALNNLMSMMIYNRETEGAIAVLKKIRGIPDHYKLKQKNYTIKIFIKTYNVELELYRDLKDWNMALHLIGEIQNFIKAQIIPNNYLLSFYYQFAYIHFQVGDNSKALAMINNILNGNFEEERLDLQTYARILYLMIHFELGNITLLKYAVENTRRYLKKRRGSLFDFEKVLLKFFAKLSVAPIANYKRHFKDLSTTLFVGHSDDQKASILDYIDFQGWIEGNIGK